MTEERASYTFRTLDGRAVVVGAEATEERDKRLHDSMLRAYLSQIADAQEAGSTALIRDLHECVAGLKDLFPALYTRQGVQA